MVNRRYYVFVLQKDYCKRLSVCADGYIFNFWHKCGPNDQMFICKDRSLKFKVETNKQN